LLQLDRRRAFDRRWKLPCCEPTKINGITDGGLHFESDSCSVRAAALHRASFREIDASIISYDDRARSTHRHYSSCGIPNKTTERRRNHVKSFLSFSAKRFHVSFWLLYTYTHTYTLSLSSYRHSALLPSACYPRSYPSLWFSTFVQHSVEKRERERNERESERRANGWNRKKHRGSKFHSAVHEKCRQPLT